MSSTAKNIYNIPAGQPFARLLARSLLDDHKDREDALAATLVLLPTRRACRVLREAFLELREGKALILPRMQPIGDLDEEELSLSMLAHADPEQTWALKPALPRMRRQILLARLVQQLHPGHTPEQALKLAEALGHLMDQIHTENRSLDNLAALVPDDFAAHWQITLTFLEILSEAWPKILAEENALDYADRRGRLIMALAAHWQAHPPSYPVIGAGSTGSIPATKTLLSVIAEMPQGRLILPGLDADMDDESWDALSETHPQFGFKHLLQQMDVPRHNVKPFEYAQNDAQNTTRQTLCREIMRPGETTQKWANLAKDSATQKTLQSALDGLSLIECEQGREEAETIAILMRETLGTPGQTACLITPNRTLATRVTAACERWSITVDDSAGLALNRSKIGTFINLVLQVALDNVAPLSLLSILKHSRCSIDIPITALDRALRGTRPAGGFDGLRGHIQAQKRLDDAIKAQALDALTQLEPLFEPLLTLHKKPDAAFQDTLNAHLTLCECLAGQDTLWAGEQGRAASSFFAELLSHAPTIAALSLPDYAATLDHFMAQAPIRPGFGAHPRLQILGQLEARLIDADLVILGGLNEGVWPPDPSVDPWMSRPMRKQFGLPSPERSIGLAAHDFMQGLCAPRVILTRALRNDGVETVPARWLQRFSAVIQAANLDDSQMRRHDVLHWARSIDEATDITPTTRPMPCPPIALRPRKLSVTQIETWLRDPYSIYARHVLALEPLEPLEKPVDAADRGNILHKALEHFTVQTRETLPENAAQILLNLTRDEIEKRHDDPHIWSFWWPRFAKSAAWLAAHETDWRNEYQNIAAETRGEYSFAAQGGKFTLSARVDRIDAGTDGHTAIIDYKSGGQYSKSGMQDGRHPQLPLEGLILREGGFADKSGTLGPRETAALQYWVFSGSGGGTITTLDNDVSTLIDDTAARLRQLVESYDDPAMPYISLPRTDQAPRFNDYEHLARIREWAVTGEEEGEAA